jgi:threonylcarbamoyladenosine tRNA methylthiotransferase MtaB
MRKRLKVVTVGCKANFADSASIARVAASEGFEVVPPGAPADVVVVNSCTVTHRADRDSRSAARRARRENPRAVVVLSGCYARVSPQARERVPEVDHWLGPDGGAPTLFALLREIGGGTAPCGPPLSEYAADLLLGHRRAFLKIQDGCDSACAYCVVPLARGKSRSRPEAEIVDAAAAAEKEGARELVLTGIHIGRYGADRGEVDGLSGLLSSLLSRTSRARFRLSSLEPKEATPDLVERIGGSPRICPHLHVPLQSGCDRTLARMRRPYRAAEYLEGLWRAVRRIPGIQVGADVMAGFPGETPGEFDETIRLLRDAPVHYLHVFPYSPRPGTESAEWRDDVPPAAKKERVARLLALDRGKREAFLRAQVGTTLEVLAEKADAARGELYGRSGNYAEVVFPGDEADAGEIHAVRALSVRGRSLTGERLG